MRKVAVARWAFVVLTLLMLAASGADKTVTDKEHAFELTFPKSWTVYGKQKGDDESVATRACSNGSRVTATVDCYSVKEGTTIKDLYSSKFGNLWFWLKTGEAKINDITAYQGIREEAPDKAIIKGLDGEEWEVGDIEVQRMEIYCIVAGKRGYVISFFCEKPDYEKYAKDIDAIVKSFKLIEAK
ncbi:MAG TPA: hypothetical protein VKX17_12060 [Planctomycetota bacterium]|nr:hypothetical protein [Planctomycetota bacterium]